MLEDKKQIGPGLEQILPAIEVSKRKRMERRILHQGGSWQLDQGGSWQTIYAKCVPILHKLPKFDPMLVMNDSSPSSYLGIGGDWCIV